MKEFSLWDEPISDNAPSGVDIEYDGRFLELQNAAEGKPEQQYGETVIPAEEPDWSAVEKLSRQLLAESKDLRVLAYYTRALTAKYGLVGLEAGCNAIRANVDLFWDTLFPQLNDEDGEYDPFYRINALSIFTTPEGIVREILGSQLLVNGLTQQAVTVREAVQLLQGNDAHNYPGGRERLLLDIRVAADSGRAELKATLHTLQHLHNIQAAFETQLDSAETLNFNAVTTPLSLIVEAAATTAASASPETEATPVQEVAISASQTVSPQPDAWRGLNLKNRADVDLALEKICVYFEQFEPSHPAPLFIRRVQRLMNMDFYDIMKDISPDSLGNLEVLIGKSGQSDETSE